MYQKVPSNVKEKDSPSRLDESSLSQLEIDDRNILLSYECKNQHESYV